ncbi:MAG: response regulator [Capsulimonadaceae bacterium]|nr:response regulator [Capsulimonadaceae bacterium]
MNEKILCVDDDPNILDAYKRSLRKIYTIDTAQGGEAGLAVLTEKGPYAVVVSDQHMPGISGVQFLAKARDVAPDTVRMMLTGNADLNVAINALNEGAIFRFLVKPVTPENMAVILEHGVAQYRLVTAERELLEKTLRGSVRILIEILSSLNPDLFGRSQLLRQEMRQISDILGLTDNWSLELAAMLAQIGMVTLPTNLFQRLEKGAPLNATEQAMLDRTPEISYKLLANIPRLEQVARMIRYQNKNYDGSGIPDDNVSGDAIPVGARILKVLLEWHQIEARGASRSGAYALMRNRRGFYDPTVFEALGRILGQPENAASKRPPIRIKLIQLKVGHVLASNMETDEGKLLIAAGHQITETLLEKIFNYSEIAGIREPIIIEQPAEPIAPLSSQPGVARRAA